MFKRIIAMLVSVMLVCANVQAAVVFDTDYMPGENMCSVTADDFLGGPHAQKTATGDAVQINAGGTANFGFYSRYATRSVTIKYTEGVGDTLTIQIGENEYNNIVLDDSGEKEVVFCENLSTGALTPQFYGYNGWETVGYYREFVEKVGEKNVAVTSSGDVIINELIFEKEKVPNINDDLADSQYTLNELQNKFLTTVLMDQRANAIVVDGAYRYISNENVTMRPYNDNGTLYIPIETLAKALGYYYEDKPGESYALMRSNTHEVVMLNNKCYVSQGVSEKQELNRNVFVYKDGETLAAVRYFAELAGETVAYKNGLVIIDNKYVVADIINDYGLITYANEQLADFKTKVVGGKTYHVSQDGSYNSTAGENVFATISDAAAVAKAGDTVIVHKGVYEETLKPANNGTANSPITFKAAENEEVVISAADKVTEWSSATATELGITDSGKTIYKSTISWDMGETRNQVFVDYVMQNEARFPNTPGVVQGSSPTLSSAWPVKGDFTRTTGADSLLKVESDLLDGTDWSGGYYVGLFGKAWNMQSGNIISSSVGELTIGSERTSGWWETSDSDPYNYGYIVGHKNALDIPGEWIKEGNNVYMIFPDGKTPENSSVFIKRRNLVVDLDYKSYINVEGFDTIGGSIRMNNSNMCMINGFDMKYVSHFIHFADGQRGYIDFDNSSGTKAGAPESGVTGNYIAGNNNIFINSTIDHSAGAGIYATGLYTYIDNNIIKDAGYAGTYVSGITVAPRLYDSKTGTLRGGHFIYNNTVYNCGRSALYMRAYKSEYTPYLPSEIAYNDFHNAMLTSADTGVIYEQFTNMECEGVPTKMHHNYVYMTTEKEDIAKTSSEIYHDNGTYGIDTYGNKLFYTELDGGFTGHFVFEQNMESSPAYIRQWDNTKIGYLPNGESALTQEYFTEEKPFYAGSLHNVDYRVNYDKFSNGDYNMLFTTASTGFEKSSNVSVPDKSGYVAFSQSGEWVKFKVNAPKNSNTIALAVKGDSHYTNDNIEVYIDSYDESPDYIQTISIGTIDLDTPETVYIHTQKLSGEHNIYIKAADYRSLEIGGISVFAAEGAEDDEKYALFEYAGGFAEKGRLIGNSAPQPVSRANNPSVIGTSILDQTHYNNYVKYPNRNVTANANSFEIVATATGVNRIQVCVGDINNVVAEVTLEGNAFSEVITETVSLERTVSAGNYDVYLKFLGGTNLLITNSATIQTFGFLK